VVVVVRVEEKAGSFDFFERGNLVLVLADPTSKGKNIA